jgi:hypothetical protein
MENTLLVKICKSSFVSKYFQIIFNAHSELLAFLIYLHDWAFHCYFWVKNYFNDIHLLYCYNYIITNWNSHQTNVPLLNQNYSLTLFTTWPDWLYHLDMFSRECSMSHMSQAASNSWSEHIISKSFQIFQVK